MIALLMKCILDLDTLRGLCLMPPEGCGLDQWQCLAGPCNTSDKLRCQNIRLVKAFRAFNGKKDNLEPDYHEKFETVWGDFKRNKAKDKDKRLGSFSPLMLFPVKLLHETVSRDILMKRPDLKDCIDKLFICCEHFQDVANDSTLSNRSLPSFSLDIINEELANGKAVFSWGRLFPKLSYVTKLLELGERSPGFNLTLPQPIVNPQILVQISRDVMAMSQRSLRIPLCRENMDNPGNGSRPGHQATNK